ncbi:MAG: NAD-dependent epimerase/dehydratase family protein, partial [Clostridium sp.]
MKKIIIFGATGNTGAYLTEYLVEKLKNFEIIAVGRKETKFFTLKYNIKYFSVDIRKKEEFEKLPIEDIYAV